MANQYINAMTAIWNSVGTTYAGIKMNVTNAASAAGSKLLQLQVGTIDKFSVDKSGNVVSAGTLAGAGVISTAVMVPLVNDGAALGTSVLSWSDLYLATGGVINWNAGDVTITHSADLLTFDGAASGYTFNGPVNLASGGVINWASGDLLLTHSADKLTLTGGSFYGDQIVVNSIAGGGGALHVIGTLDASGSVTSNGGWVTSVNGAAGGQPAVGAWSTDRGTVAGFWNPSNYTGISFGSLSGVGVPAALWATLDNGGTFTCASVSSSGHVYSASGGFISTAANVYLYTHGGTYAPIQCTYNSVHVVGGLSADIYVNASSCTFTSATVGGCLINSGNMSMPGSITMNGSISAPLGNISTSGVTASSGVFAGTNGIYLRPYGLGNDAYQSYVDGSGNFVCAGGVYAGGIVSATTALYAVGGNIVAANGGSGRYLSFQSGWYFDFNTANGDLYWRGASHWHMFFADGNFRITGTVGTKAAGTAWAVFSDIRIKNVRGDYQKGLAEILQVRPIRYDLKDDPDHKEHVSVVAQEIEGIFPETISLIEGKVDGQDVNDLRTFDPTAVTFALINAVKELSAKLDDANARIAALEAV
jgi:hypothetical protein